MGAKIFVILIVGLLVWSGTCMLCVFIDMLSPVDEKTFHKMILGTTIGTILAMIPFAALLVL